MSGSDDSHPLDEGIVEGISHDCSSSLNLTNVYTNDIHKLMDVHFPFQGLHFVWDSDKAITNRATHGIAFENACEVFFDILNVYVDASNRTEERTAVIGVDSSSRLLYVVHVELEEQRRIRIISVREAERQERKAYEDG